MKKWSVKQVKHLKNYSSICKWNGLELTGVAKAKITERIILLLQNFSIINAKMVILCLNNIVVDKHCFYLHVDKKCRLLHSRN